MPISDRLHALSPYDGRYKELGDKIALWFSEAGLIQARVIVETEYFLALSKEKIIREFSSKEKAFVKQLGRLNDSSLTKIKEIESKTNHDVQAVVVFLRENLAKTTLRDVAEFIHFGLTSEDVNNLAWRMSLAGARDGELIPSIDAFVTQLSKLAETYKTKGMLARTHGQPAIPTTFGKELINFAVRLHKERQKLSAFQFAGKCNGAVGNLNAHRLTYPDVDWVAFFDNFIRDLGMLPNHFTTQVNPNDDIAEYLQIIERINTILHGFAADMWRYISDGLVMQKPDGVGSSTMPQKINPIHFEHSEGVTELSGGLIRVLVERLPESRLQRDLSDTPLFRFLGEIHAMTADALGRMTKSLSTVTFHEQKAHDMLFENFAILSEPLQLLLKKAQVKSAYDLVKKYTQGKQFTQSSWKKMTNGLLKDLHISDKKLIDQLQTLSPDTYCGDASRFVDKGVKEIRARR